MRSLLPLLILACLPLKAFGDGKIFPATAVAANVTIPDQRALIHFADGTERLVIETSFIGEGTNFAWVIPLPSPPVIEEASTGLFPTLQHLFQPQVHHRVARHYGWILALASFAYLILFVRPNSRPNFSDVLACASMAAGAGALHPRFGLAAGLILLAAVVLIRVLKQPVSAILGLLLFLILAAAALLPSSLSKEAALAPPDSSSAVSILDRQIVGVFETITIESRESGPLQQWLSENGFAVASNAAPVIESYIKAGWVFVGARLRRDHPEKHASTPHPLSFTFPTPNPVYPMRLTGVDNGPLQVELYVFGPDRARALQFKTERCTRLDYPPPAGYQTWSHSVPPETPIIVHPLLRKWVDGAPVATRLTATLAPSEMKEDVWLTWSPFEEKRDQWFTASGARTIALNWACGVFVVALGASYLLTRNRQHRSLSTSAALLAAFSFGLGCVIYLSLPKTEVRFIDRSGSTALVNASNVFYDSREEKMTAAEMRVATQDLIARSSNDRLMNPLLGRRIREEDSPGNFIIRNTTNGWEFVVFDTLGAEYVLSF